MVREHRSKKNRQKSLLSLIHKRFIGIFLFFITFSVVILSPVLFPSSLSSALSPQRLSPVEIQGIQPIIIPNLLNQILLENTPDPPQTAIQKSNDQRISEQESHSGKIGYATIDILWLLLCSGLVFLMQAGFMCVESGFTRSKNSINVAVKNFTDFGVSVALFWAYGFAIMFSPSWMGWIGTKGFFLESDLTPFQTAFFVFQAMFCGTATTIVSGAVAERMKFSAYLIVAALVSGLAYPLFGHWAWNGVDTGELGGWLGKLGFVDFAGSTVVHSVGGWVSLAALFIVGARRGRFPEQGSPEKFHGSNLPLSVLGALLLWFGWFGFNGGSTLALNQQVANIIVNTVLGGVAGMITALAVGWKLRQVPDVDLLINGSLAGLVAITASCHAVTPLSSVIIGAIGGIVVLFVEALLLRFKIDDAVGAIPVHLGGGIWGTIAVALFSNLEQLGTGLNRIQQLGIQVLGIGTCFIIAFCLTYLILLGLNRWFPLRVSLEDELIGLNVSEHRAKTEILDLFRVMDSQSKIQDLSLRVPVEPFTEVGQIATRYNEVMDALESAVTRTHAIVSTATDAIITFTKPDLKIISANPQTEEIFSFKVQHLINSNLANIVAFEFGFLDQNNNEISQAKGKSLLPFSSGSSLNLANQSLEHRNQSFLNSSPLFFYPNLENNFGSYYYFQKANFVDNLYDQTNFAIPDQQTEAYSYDYNFKPLNCIDVQITSLTRQEIVAEIVASNTPRELWGIRSDGSIFPLEVSINEAKSSKETFYTGTFRDITHRKLAEVALQESEERFRKLSEATFEGIIIYENAKIVDANQAFAQLFGYRIYEVIGRDALDFIASEYHPFDLEKIQADDEKVYEMMGLRKDGSRFPIEVEGKSIPSQGKRVRVVAIRDITQRQEAEAALRESEERFRTVVEQAADAFILHDLNGKIVDVNQHACESLGYTRSELLKLSIQDIEDNFDSESLLQQWQQMSPGLALTVQGLQRRKDGSQFPVEIRNCMIIAGHQKLILGLCRDVTERKKAEQALREEQEKSERLLLNVLPKAIAEQLKENQGTIADGFTEATVLFADLVGFTNLASRISPTELVHFLNEIFSTFDLLAEQHGLEKIKTIGDAYMVVGGIPIPRDDHAEAIAQMALDMQAEIQRFSQQRGESFEMRIGINTGPVVAGVIGLKKFIYDLWGDTVNIAARMESHGLPGSIQITESTAERLQGKFKIGEPRMIYVKGKGEMLAYLLLEKIDSPSL